MASKLFKQFLYSTNPMLTYIEGSFKVGASGAVKPSTGILGTGVQSVTRAAQGQYVIGLTDNYNRFLGLDCTLLAPTSGAGSVTDGSFVVGQAYQITFPSTSTNWQTVGLPSGLVATIGMPFVATSGASNGGAGGAVGNGTAIRITNTGIQQVEMLPNPNTILGPTNTTQTQGAYFNLQTLNGSSVPTDPTSGSVVRFGLFLRNSSLLGTNETSSNY